MNKKRILLGLVLLCLAGLFIPQKLIMPVVRLGKGSILLVALKTLATGLILAHNHPSGNPKPSEADVNLTKKIKEAAKLMDIQVLDHIILGDDGYFSFSDEGIPF